MSKRYHDDFPAAPTSLIAGIAAACVIPTIIAARVGKDGSVYLDIFENDDYQLDLDSLNEIADFFEVEGDEVFVEPGPESDTITVSVSSSCYDFSAQFIERSAPLPGEEDSEESVEASVSLALSRRI
jgi:hypothetical protein